MREEITELYATIPTNKLSIAARESDCEIRFAAHYYDVRKKDKIIRMSLMHLHYGYDIIGSFDYYFDAVIPYESAGFLITDYSTPRYHDVQNFELMPIFSTHWQSR